MFGLKLVRVIERHSEELALELARQVRGSERTCDFKKIPSEELHLAALDVYRHLKSGYCKNGRRISRSGSEQLPRAAPPAGSAYLSSFGP